ncbi:hypothetical protein FLX56_17165 [Synechococcus moorigangaii CMS01]|nr:hypothetical protein [Synechococcus moorigangaii CMS01]
MLIEPSVLRAAQQIYNQYVAVHPVRSQYVTGVSINPKTLQGFVSFREGNVLLPREVFIPVEQLMSYDA